MWFLWLDFFCWESNKNDVEMGLLPNQIASCIDKLSWCFAWSWPGVFRGSIVGFVRLCLGLYFQSFSTFVPVEREEVGLWQIYCQIAHNSTKNETDMAQAIHGDRFMLCAALNHRSIYFKETTCPLYYISDRHSFEEMLTPPVQLLPGMLHILLQSITFVGTGKFIWQRKAGV